MTSSPHVARPASADPFLDFETAHTRAVRCPGGRLARLTIPCGRVGTPAPKGQILPGTSQAPGPHGPGKSEEPTQARLRGRHRTAPIASRSHPSDPVSQRSPVPAQPRRTHALRRPPHRPARRRCRHHAGAGRPRLARRPDGRGRAERHPVGRPGPAARGVGAGCRGRAAHPRGRQPACRAHDRPGLPRHHHPAGDPAQRARGPELVHRLHALPARDLPGSARGPAQLPDRRRRPGRPADGQRVVARRGHCSGGGDDPRTPRQPEGDRALRGRRRQPPADHRGDPHAREGDGDRGGRRRPRRGPARRRPTVRSPGCWCPTREPRAGSSTHAR